MKPKHRLKPLVCTLLPALLFSVSLFLGYAANTKAIPTVVDNLDYTAGQIYKTYDTYDGYTMSYPLRSTTTYKIDTYGEMVQSRPCDHISNEVYLLEHGI